MGQGYARPRWPVSRPSARNDARRSPPCVVLDPPNARGIPAGLRPRLSAPAHAPASACGLVTASLAGGRSHDGPPMTVRVRLFAVLRERAGRDTIGLDLPEGAGVADALAAVDDLAGGLSLVLAVNREYATPDAPLSAGDELALIPPVSGGA